MTVLQQKQVSTGQLGQLGRIVGSMLIIGVVAGAAIFTISRVDSVPTASAAYEQAMQARGQAADVFYKDQLYEQAMQARGQAADVFYGDQLYVQAMQARGQAADVFYGAQSSEPLDPLSRNRGFPIPPPQVTDTTVFTAE
jgi:hypothetical protein